MKTLRAKLQSFIDKLLEEANKRGYADISGSHGYQPNFMVDEIRIDLTIDGKMDSYILGENHTGVYWVRIWNGVR